MTEPEKKFLPGLAKLKIARKPFLPQLEEKAWPGTGTQPAKKRKVLFHRWLM